jgi:hypothetical protein
VPDNLVQAFDPATGTTTVIGHMPGPRAGLVGAAVGNEVVLLAGFNGSALVGNVWTTSDGTSFSVAGQIATVERYPAIAVVGTTIYLFGGLVAGGEYNGTFSATVQSFDVATRQGHVVGQLPVPLAHARAAVLDGPLLVFGVAAYLVSGPAVSPGGALRPLVQVVALSLGATPSTGSMQAPLWRPLSLACGASRQCRLSTLVSEFSEHASVCLSVGCSRKGASSVHESPGWGPRWGPRGGWPSRRAPLSALPASGSVPSPIQSALKRTAGAVG